MIEMFEREIYEGECHGGPLKGKHLRHYASTYTVMKPAMEVKLFNIEDAEVFAVKCGTYVYAATGVWKWVPA